MGLFAGLARHPQDHRPHHLLIPLRARPSDPLPVRPRSGHASLWPQRRRGVRPRLPRHHALWQRPHPGGALRPQAQPAHRLHTHLLRPGLRHPQHRLRQRRPAQADQNQEVIAFCDHWRQVHGQDPNCSSSTPTSPPMLTSANSTSAASASSPCAPDDPPCSSSSPSFPTQRGSRSSSSDLRSNFGDRVPESQRTTSCGLARAGIEFSRAMCPAYVTAMRRSGRRPRRGRG